MKRQECLFRLDLISVYITSGTSQLFFGFGQRDVTYSSLGKSAGNRGKSDMMTSKSLIYEEQNFV